MVPAMFLLYIVCVFLNQGLTTALLNPRRYRPDTFQYPRAGVRWRHWIQDAWIEDTVLASDVQQMAMVGSEGFELLSYQSYGQRGPTLEDPEVYSYGAEKWAEVLTSYANEANRNGLYIDWAMGPNQAAGVPYNPDEVDQIGFNTELVMGRSEFLPSGTLWNGSIPDPELVPVTGYDGLVNFTAPTTREHLEGLVAIQILPTDNLTTQTLDLNYSTIQNLLPLVNDSRTTFTTQSGEDTIILAFYSRRNGYPEAVPGFEGPQSGLPGSWGSYVHDHFSVEGAQKAIESNQAWVLSHAQAALNQDGTGVAMWTDSNEFRAQLYWTHNLAERFASDHDYSIHLALPVLFGGARPFSGANTPSQVYDYGNSFDSERFRNDYKQTLTNAYLDYGKALTEYARTIGLKYSDQPAYNFPLDVGAASTIADIPECESLGQPSIDLIRQFTGGVSLSGRNIFSSEMGAGRYQAYESTMKQLIGDARLAFAGGVNQVILHGYPSSTNYVETSWPGLTPFVYEFSELHGPRQPAWKHYDQYMEMFGREMWLLRRGVPKVDIAILRYGWDLEFNSSDKTIRNYVFSTDDLTRAGYSYDYVSSFALGLDNATVQEGRLMPSGPGYKALILNHSQNMTVEAAARVLSLAQEGLPVVILGDVPNDVPGFDSDESGKANVKSTMAQLLQLENVVQVSQEAQVPMTLARLGANSSVNISSEIIDYPPVVRRRSTEDAELYYVLNQGSSSTVTMSFEAPSAEHAHMFVMDQLTGITRPCARAKYMSSSTDLPRFEVVFDMATNQSLLFAITKSSAFQNASSLSQTIIALDSDMQAIALQDGTGIELRSFMTSTTSFTLSNGSSVAANFSLCDQVSHNLTSWNLTIESWTPTSNLSSVDTVKMNSSIELDRLVPWDEVEGYYNVSGIGYYSTRFFLPDSDCAALSIGAELRQSSIFHTQRVRLNGQLLPMMDPINPVIDISPWLRVNEENELAIVIATPLLNALNALNDDEVMSVGYSRARKLAEGKVKRGHQKYGLTGSVEIVPFARYTVHF